MSRFWRARLGVPIAGPPGPPGADGHHGLMSKETRRGVFIVTLSGSYPDFVREAATIEGARVIRELPPGRAVVMLDGAAELVGLRGLDSVLDAVPDALEQTLQGRPAPS
jgi:hypothetical protein